MMLRSGRSVVMRALFADPTAFAMESCAARIGEKLPGVGVHAGDLPRPRRIDEAVPANLSSGMRHDVDGALLLQPRAGQGGYVQATQIACKLRVMLKFIRNPVYSLMKYGDFRSPFS